MQRYNSRHRLFGHLFQGRYKAVIVESQQEHYFQVVSTYIHLNPARAGLIRIGQERLNRYRWSSYPWYLNRLGNRAKWLHTQRVMGSLNLRPQEVEGYEVYIEGRVLELASKKGRKKMDEEWKELRRGWYVGDTGFAEKLQDYLAKAIVGRRRESHSGPAKVAAEAQLQRALPLLGLSVATLKELPNSAPEKVVLAWWLRQYTTVSLRWVSERLGMGHYTRVTQAISRASRRPNRRHKQLKQKLREMTEQTQEQ